ncbi:MAG: methylated-DNA--[protein]-cysteine S-methyltransferase [Eubacteriales bacterium]|jgi:methylated-DNA-[protein]-cysteine S-methyltransferase|nr:methylated-DNA--[protein]-cysteine S-methyltransferase [Eubacteriales bacterium]MDD4711666.1 methylated-DNA--[protein]-cysteine S-methyltransferase [Eubacteriales bacterium]
MNHISTYKSPLGVITILSDEDHLTGLWFENEKYRKTPIGQELTKEKSDVLRLTAAWLDIYFAGRDPGFTPPLKWKGSPFRMAVWEILSTIPYGTVITYGDIAKQLAKGGRMSAQAVGGAVGHNNISIIVPCHRVVGANGNLTGYGGGMSRKVALLTLEKVDMSGMRIPTKGTAL